MALSPISRRAGMLSLTAAVLIVLSQVMRLAVGRPLGEDEATTPAHALTYSLALRSVLAGAVATVGLYTVGWTLFGLAVLRACAFPRATGLLLLVGGLAGPLALSTPYQILLAIAIGWIGLIIGSKPRSGYTAATPPPGPPLARRPVTDSSSTNRAEEMP